MILTNHRRRFRWRLRRVVFVVLTALVLAGCSQLSGGSPSSSSARPVLNLEQLAGQRVIYAFSGPVPNQPLLYAISHGEAAGVIFFSDNFTSTDQFRSLVAELVRANNSPSNPVRHPLLLMTDQEGGKVKRLPGGPDQSEKKIGELSGDAAQSAATAAGNGAAQTLKTFGLNANLAPVLDVYNQTGNFIDQWGRSYSSSPSLAGSLGAAYVRALQASGVAATAKHFPGLGAAATGQDTDAVPVTLHQDLNYIRQVDEAPYAGAISAGVKLVMASWAVYPALDPNRPAGFSSTIIQGELRRRLGYQGVTITDAIGAGALNDFGSVGNHALLAAGAGMDLMLATAPGQGTAARQALAGAYRSGRLDHAAFLVAVDRIEALRASL